MAHLHANRALAIAAAIIGCALGTLPALAGQMNTIEPARSGSDDVAKRPAVANVEGVSIHYDVYGDVRSAKTPLLVLHGAYMSAHSMTPLVERFARTRPVIVIDQRGHGRTGGVEGSITYEALADDAAAVLDAAGIRQADVIGYSLGGSVAVQLVIRHPDKVAKLVPVSAGVRLDATYPEVLAGISEITASTFDDTPIRSEYDRLAKEPADFPILVEKLKELDATPFDWSAAMRTLTHRTMIVMGDHDIIGPEHAVEMFRMRGGGAPELAAQGFLSSPPPARLLILPASSHIGVMAEAEVIAVFVASFLDDATPPMPQGFF